MANTYTSLDFHLIFSTREREPLIARAIEERIWAFMAGIASENGMVPKRFGGVEDHVHLLLGIPAGMSVAKAVKLIKGGSSLWINQEKVLGPNAGHFQWQEGYGAFTVSRSMAAEVSAYIARQREHHRKRTFQEEYRDFLEKHGVDYDERYLWG
ncbi:MAG: IS200/IS605 family transposase [Verrucomicrobiae bacterium]|nr:IS200/IS605 family transposase [Verrucomicrobiae bacterium]